MLPGDQIAWRDWWLQYHMQFLGQHIHMAATKNFKNNEYPKDLVVETRVYGRAVVDHSRRCS